MQLLAGAVAAYLGVGKVRNQFPGDVVVSVPVHGELHGAVVVDEMVNQTVEGIIFETGSVSL